MTVKGTRSIVSVRPIERQRENGDERHGPRRREQTNGEAEILTEALERTRDPHVSCAILRQRAAAEGAPRRQRYVDPIDAVRLELALGHRLMEGDFLGKVCAALPFANRIPRAAEQLAHREPLLRRVQDPAHRENDAVEFRALDRQAAAAGGRQRVVPRAAVVLRRAPRGRHPSLEQQPLQRGIERALADLQHVAGHALQMLGDPVAVRGAGRQRPEDQQIERPRQQLRALAFTHRLSMEE
jgi:hypothetical protein